MSRAPGKSKRDDTADEFYVMLAQLKAQKTQAGAVPVGSEWRHARAELQGELEKTNANMLEALNNIRDQSKAFIGSVDDGVSSAGSKSKSLADGHLQAFAKDQADLQQLRQDLSAAVNRLHRAISAADQDAARMYVSESKRLADLAAREFADEVDSLHKGLTDKAKAAAEYMGGGGGNSSFE
jgi:hypothetical protein